MQQNINNKYFRYKDIAPYDSNRVMILPPYSIAGDSEPSDYINASFISDVMLGTSRKYIAAQVNNILNMDYGTIYKLCKCMLIIFRVLVRTPPLPSGA
jgi:protein tyrosine phosphatase